MTDTQIIELENDAAEYESYASRMEFELREFSVMCEVCCETDRGSQMQLINRGWILDRSGEWCGLHRGN